MTYLDIFRVVEVCMSRTYGLESLALLMIAAADSLWTLIVVGRGDAIEANGIMAFYLEYGAMYFVAAKLLITIGALLLLWGFYSRRLWPRYIKRPPRFYQQLLRVAIMGYIVVYALLVVRVNSA